MKVTMYELLGLVKDGKAPKKVKYDGQEYKITKILLEDNNYYFNFINEDMECIFPINTNHLNDEVEIIEEENKIPEKIKSNGEEYYCEYIYSWIDKEKTSAYCEYLMNKYNDLIDYLKSKGE